MDAHGTKTMDLSKWARNPLRESCYVDIRSRRNSTYQLEEKDLLMIEPLLSLRYWCYKLMLYFREWRAYSVVLHA